MDCGHMLGPFAPFRSLDSWFDFHSFLCCLSVCLCLYLCLHIKGHTVGASDEGHCSNNPGGVRILIVLLTVLGKEGYHCGKAMWHAKRIQRENVHHDSEAPPLWTTLLQPLPLLKKQILKQSFAVIVSRRNAMRRFKTLQ